MIVVSDTSPIGSLILIERLELLPAIFGQVLIPEKVFKELLVLETDFGPFLVFPIKAKIFQTKPKRGGKKIAAFLSHIGIQKPNKKRCHPEPFLPPPPQCLDNNNCQRGW
jgi:hypothetical protein